MARPPPPKPSPTSGAHSPARSGPVQAVRSICRQEQATASLAKGDQPPRLRGGSPAPRPLAAVMLSEAKHPAVPVFRAFRPESILLPPLRLPVKPFLCQQHTPCPPHLSAN